MTPRVVVLTHFLHNRQLRVTLWSEDTGNGRHFYCPEHPQYGVMPECLFRETREQISDLLGEYERDPMEGIAAHDDRREALSAWPWR